MKGKKWKRMQQTKKGKSAKGSYEWKEERGKQWQGKGDEGKEGKWWGRERERKDKGEKK